MKKLYPLLLLFLFALQYSTAQNIQLMAGREYKLVVEVESLGKNHFRYAYIDATFDSNLRKDISIASFIQIIDLYIKYTLFIKYCQVFLSILTNLHKKVTVFEQN